MTIYTIVFAIDNVLISSYSSSKKKIKLFKKKGLLINAKPQFSVLPGVVETIQLLFQQNDVRVAFFSDQVQKRDELFVKKLLKHSLGKEHYLKIKDTVKIFSSFKNDKSSDLITQSEEEDLQQGSMYEYLGGTLKKPLNIIVSKEELENCMLIENKRSYIQFGYEKNFAFFPGCYTSYKFNSKWNWHENGLIKIPFHYCEKINKDFIFASNYIALHFNHDHWIIGFIHKNEAQYLKLKIRKAENSIIFNAIHSHFNPHFKGLKSKLSKEETESLLYELIDQNEGKIGKICREYNLFCYATGLIFAALNHARTHSTPISDFLFPLHFSKEGNRYKSLFRSELAAHKKDKFYLLGLEYIQQINPSFTLITHKTYCEILEESED